MHVLLTEASNLSVGCGAIRLPKINGQVYLWSCEVEPA